MIAIISYFSGDHHQAVRLAEWIAELGGVEKHDCILAVNADTVTEGVLEPLQRVFRRVTHFSITEPMRNERSMYAYCANIHWKSCARLMAALAEDSPWMFIEPDAVPLCPEWLDRIEEEYKAGGKPFLLDIVRWNGSTHPSGVGVYPRDVHKYTSRMWELGNDPWDVFFKDDFLPHTRRSKCIHDNVAMKPDPLFLCAGSMAVIREGAVFFHRDKSGDLIDRLREKRGGVPIARAAHHSEVAGSIPAPATFPARRIYAYNEDVGGAFADPAMVSMCVKSFARQGFDVVILDAAEAAVHPLFEKLSTHPNLYEGGRITPYLRACYRRWMAVAMRARYDGETAPVMVDLDVMNYGFLPGMLPPAKDTMTMMNVMAVPGMMIGTQTAFERIIAAFGEYAGKPVPLAKKTVHDQNIVELRTDLWLVDTRGLLIEYPTEGWLTAPLVHYPLGRLPYPGERGNRIRELRNPAPESAAPAPAPDPTAALLARITELEAMVKRNAPAVTAPPVQNGTAPIKRRRGKAAKVRTPEQIAAAKVRMAKARAARGVAV